MYPLFTEKLKVDCLTVSISNLPPQLEGITIAQLTDFHYDGFHLEQSLLEEAIAATKAANPNIIVLTGDYISYEPEPIHQLTLFLKHLNSQQGIYAVLGNHDHYTPQSKLMITEALQNIGIQVLCNQVVYPFGSEFALVGLGDLRSREFHPQLILDTIDQNIPRVILAHNPDCAELLQKWRVDLQLSGHTHGGQIVLPILGVLPALRNKIRRFIPKPLRRWIPYMNCHFVYKHWEWASGLHQVGNNLLYVNRGLGTYFPGRFRCPPEVTIITLKAK